jgi:hypothetical protein
MDAKGARALAERIAPQQQKAAATASPTESNTSLDADVIDEAPSVDEKPSST